MDYKKVLEIRSRSSQCVTEASITSIFTSIGDAWLGIQRDIIKRGMIVDDFIEALNVSFNIIDVRLPDLILDRWANKFYIDEMKKVFNSTETNHFGHSYYKCMSGPSSGDPIEAVITKLTSKISSRQAVITLSGNGNGKIPCVNVIQFLVRDDLLVVTYFARSQDIFNKFYADALCVFDFAQKVSKRMLIPQISIRGSIGSAHIYQKDILQASTVLESTAEVSKCA
jgi:thymidylate synthase